MHLSHSAAMRLMAFGICASTIAAAPARAADLPAAPAGACELHIWPAERFMAHAAGFGIGFGLIGGIADAVGHQEGDKKRGGALAGALDGSRQLAAIEAADPAAALHLASYQVVTHNEVLDPKTISAKARHAASASPCYAELIVSGIVYVKGPMRAPVLTADFVYRKFGAKQKPVSSYHNSMHVDAKIEQGREPEGIAAADQQLADAFAEDFKRFAFYAASQPDWK